MQTIIITKYIQGLASFFDENNIKWDLMPNEQIKIYYHNSEDLFRIGFEFGKFYEKVD